MPHLVDEACSQTDQLQRFVLWDLNRIDVDVGGGAGIRVLELHRVRPIAQGGRQGPGLLPSQ